MPDILVILKQVMESSSQLSEWALLILGGSVVTILSTSYRRPRRIFYRLHFLLFLPGWLCLAYSLSLANRLVGKYLASLMVDKSHLQSIAKQVNDIYSDQLSFLLYSLLFFGMWLIIHLMIWLFTDVLQEEKA